MVMSADCGQYMRIYVHLYGAYRFFTLARQPNHWRTVGRTQAQQHQHHGRLKAKTYSTNTTPDVENRRSPTTSSGNRFVADFAGACAPGAYTIKL